MGAANIKLTTRLRAGGQVYTPGVLRAKQVESLRDALPESELKELLQNGTLVTVSPDSPEITGIQPDQAHTRLRVGGRVIKPGELTADDVELIREALDIKALNRLVAQGVLDIRLDNANSTTAAPAGQPEPPPGGGDAGAGGDANASGQSNGESRGNTSIAPGYRGYEIDADTMESLPDDLDRALVEVWRALDVKDEKHWTTDGKPDANALTRGLGRQVKADERDALVAALAAWLKPAQPPAEPDNQG